MAVFPPLRLTAFFAPALIGSVERAGAGLNPGSKLCSLCSIASSWRRFRIEADAEQGHLPAHQRWTKPHYRHFALGQRPYVHETIPRISYHGPRDGHVPEGSALSRRFLPRLLAHRMRKLTSQSLVRFLDL